MELNEAILHARQMAEGCPSENRDCAYQHDKLADWLEELKKYKDLEEQGQLVILPCKVGKTVRGRDNRWIGTIEEFTFNSDGMMLYIRSGGGGFYVRPDQIDEEILYPIGYRSMNQNDTAM